MDTKAEIMSPRLKKTLRKLSKMIIVIIEETTNKVETLIMEEEEDIIMEVEVHTLLA